VSQVAGTLSRRDWVDKQRNAQIWMSQGIFYFISNLAFMFNITRMQIKGIWNHVLGAQWCYILLSISLSLLLLSALSSANFIFVLTSISWVPRPCHSFILANYQIMFSSPSLSSGAALPIVTCPANLGPSLLQQLYGHNSTFFGSNKRNCNWQPCLRRLEIRWLRLRLKRIPRLHSRQRC
jgi:hypothetical protein